MTTNPGTYCVQLPDGQELWVDLRFDNGDYVARVNGESHRLSLRPGRNGAVLVGVDEVTYQVGHDEGAARLVNGHTSTPLSDISARCAGQMALQNKTVAVQIPKTEGSQNVPSPLTGKLIDICVAPGQRVERGQTLVIVEAMKMENRVSAPCDGVVISVSAEIGNIIRLGDSLLTLEAL